MSIQPYRRAPYPRPVGVLLESGKVLTEDGRKVPLHDIDDRTVLYASWRTASRRAHRGIGRLFYFHDTPTRFEEPIRNYEHARRARVYLLPDDGSTNADILTGLATIRDFLTSKGAAGTSTTKRSVSLLRATLDRPLYTFGGPDPVPIREVVGGRQETVRYGIWPRDFIGLDISGAYFNALGRMHYGGRWERITLDGLLEPQEPRQAFHNARVTVPAGGLGPLPRRRRGPVKGRSIDRLDTLREYPVDLTFKGIWSNAELCSAERAGCDVKLLRSWIDTGDISSQPFAAWHTAIDEARTLPGLAGTYGKMLGNVLVGWLMSRPGPTYWFEWNPDNTIHRRGMLKGRTRPAHTSPLDLAELVTSTVRAKLNDDVLVPFAPRVIGCHTDGVFLTGSETNPIPDGWRVKHRGTGIAFIHPQVWAYRNVDGWVYCYSGIPAPEVARAFNESASQKFGKSWKRQIPTTREEPWQTTLIA